MSYANMIPKIWSARFKANLDMNLVYTNLTNRSWQPDALYGNIVSIPGLGDVTIGDYTKNTDIADTEVLTSTEDQILINQQKYFNIEVDSIDEAQTQPRLMDKNMERAGFGMAQTTDNFVGSSMVLGADAANIIGTPAVPETVDETSIYGYLTEMQRLLDLAHVPSADRWLVMDPDGIKLLKDSGEFLSDTSAGDLLRLQGMFGVDGVLPPGFKGFAAGFSLWSSTQDVLPVGAVSEHAWVFGHSIAFGFVDSINKLVGYTPEKRFGDAVKGLYVYGGTAVYPSALGVMYAGLT